MRVTSRWGAGTSRAGPVPPAVLDVVLAAYSAVPRGWHTGPAAEAVRGNFAENRSKLLITREMCAWRGFPVLLGRVGGCWFRQPGPGSTPALPQLCTVSVLALASEELPVVPREQAPVKRQAIAVAEPVKTSDRACTGCWGAAPPPDQRRILACAAAPLKGTGRAH